MKEIHPLGAQAASLCLALTATIVACGDDTVAPTSSSSSGSSTGTGGTGTGGTGTGGTGTGGTGTGGTGTGGTGSDCLPVAEYDDVFVIEDPSLCVVGKYVTDEQANDFTFGAHGGPMFVRTIPDSGGAALSDAEVVRLMPPSQPVGTLTATPLAYDMNIDPSMQFLGPQAIDIPGTTPGTILSYTGFDTTGEVRLFEGLTPTEAVPMVGFFHGAVVPTSTGSRLLHTASTALGDGVAANANSGLYQAELCAGVTLCTSPAASLVDAWGEFNGSVGFDGAANGFATQFDATAAITELRAFPAASIAPGASTPAMGITLGTHNGSGTALAALEATDTDSGWVLLQPVSFDAQFNAIPDDVLAYRYTDTGGVIASDGTESYILTLPGDPKPQVSLVTDTALGQIWVGVPGMNGTTFYVLARAQ